MAAAKNEFGIKDLKDFSAAQLRSMNLLLFPVSHLLLTGQRERLRKSRLGMKAVDRGGGRQQLRGHPLGKTNE